MPELAPLGFSVTRTVGASAGRVWNVLGDFGTEHRWTRSLVHCERDTPVAGVGTVRECTLPRPLMGRTKVREQLIEYVPGKSLAYRLDGPAGPFAQAASRWSIAPRGEGATAVTVEGSFVPRNAAVRWLVWPLVRPMVARLTRRVLGELNAFVS